MKLQQALDVSQGDVVSFIGAGGTTSLLVGLGYELAEAGWRVLATTSTSLSQDQLELFPRALPYDSDARTISQALSDDRFVLLYNDIRRGRVTGPAVEWVPQLLDNVDSDVLLVEADESDGLPFKAPLPTQPRIPLETSLVVPVASLEALGKPLDDEHVYNPQAMIDRYGFVLNSPVKSPWLAQVLRDEELGLKDVPQNARVVVFLNRTPERGYLRGRARLIARLSLQSERIQAVALGSVRAAEPVHEVQRALGAIILAADYTLEQKSRSSWQNSKPVIAHVGEQLLRSRIDHIRVAAGVRSREVKAMLKPLGLKVVRCRSAKPASRTAQSDPATSSDLLELQGATLSLLKTGLKAMPSHVAAALVVQGDHVRLQPKVVYQLMTAYARGAGDLLIPRFRRSTGQPCLIGRRYWPEILSLKRNGRLKDVLDRHQDRLTYIDVDNDSVLPEGETARLYRQPQRRTRLKDRPN